MRKKTSGLLIRLIDVVLILLFGFISISQLERRSRIRLPESTETPLSPPDTENLIRIGIGLQGGTWGWWVENETRFLESPRQLDRYLKDRKAFFRGSVRVKIYSQATAPIKYAMTAADLCVRLDLKKSLIVRRTTRDQHPVDI